MDERIWESLQRLTVVANKLSFQRVDAGAQPRTPSPDDPSRTASPSPEPDWEGMTREADEAEALLVTTWNRFQGMNMHTTDRDNGEWLFRNQMVSSEREYGDFIETHTPRNPIGTITFGNGSYYKFVIRVHDTHRDKMVIDASGRGGPAGTMQPYTVAQFNYTGTPEEIVNHLNGMIGDPISPTGVEEIIHGFYF